jgi:hypothetical protein
MAVFSSIPKWTRLFWILILNSQHYNQILKTERIVKVIRMWSHYEYGVRPGFILTDIHASGGESDRVNRIKT